VKSKESCEDASVYEATGCHLSDADSHVVVHSARVRRTVTDKEKSDILNRHNALRAGEGASNMEYMTWNESLATAAAELVAQCNWGHAFPPLPGTKFTTYTDRIFSW